MLVAHDLGTTGNKASLHDDSGRLLAATTVTYPTRYAPGGVAEQDPRDWWHAVCTATRHLLAETETTPAEVAAVSFSGQMMGAVLLDAAMEPVRPAMIWAHQAVEQFEGSNDGRRREEDEDRSAGARRHDAGSAPHECTPASDLRRSTWRRTQRQCR